MSKNMSEQMAEPLAARALAAFLGALCLSAPAAPLQAATSAEQARVQAEIANTRIVRDDWGIAHVHGKSDADAVFGMIYAQAEDDFNRIETNYLNAMGRLGEAEGVTAIWSDLRMRLFISPADLRARYAASPAWLKGLMIAWADGLNLYLRSHPEVHPRVLTHFEPWMALSFSEGSIGGDTERVALKALQAFYGTSGGTSGGTAGGTPGGTPADAAPRTAGNAAPLEPGGSNGIAIAPADTLNHHALLLINPHTSFFFRSELQVTSDEGLDVYGAATWGQFFIYQGFNARLGWMHTSSGVDNVDFFQESILKRRGRYYYRYGNEQRPVGQLRVRIAYRDPAGRLEQRTFTVYRTHHGPVIAGKDGRWISIALMQKPVEALSQSYLLTKARNYAEFMSTMEFKANSSNNTIYADADGNIAYLHPQFVPRRDDRFDFTHPVDGSDPATDWQPLHALAELPQVLNPPVGWIMNTNDWPYSAAGPDSPKREAFPRYMDTAGENPRGVHATRLLESQKDFTAATLNQAAYDSYLPGFEPLIPDLLADYDRLEDSDPMKAGLADPIAALRGWNLRWSAESVPTTLAVLWGDEVRLHATPRLAALAQVCDRLTHDFGTWRVPWGEVNRYQRLTADIVQNFSDAAASVPVAFTAARWGSLAAFEARRYPGTARYYGTSGNSFVAIVEFGDRVSAWAVSTGGESGHPQSMHFSDQATRYAQGALRAVYFYPADLEGHIERAYRPR
jgi:acyl-homoserine-lactone acylase